MSLRTMMNAIRKSTESSSYSESKLSVPTGFIDTGCYAVNRIISGSIYNGIPEGRITTFFGESGCVTGDTLIKGLVRVSQKNSKYLITYNGYSASEFKCSYAKKIQWLIDIGYSLCEISRELKISRQTLNNIKNGSQKCVRSTTKNKIDSLINRNTYNIKIINMDNVKDNSISLKVATPLGFEDCSHLIKKGVKPCKKIVTSKKSCTFSNDHLLKREDDEFIFVENLKVNDVLLLENCKDQITEIIDVGEMDCYDIEIFNDFHTYYTNEFVSHNSGKSRIVAQIIINAITKNNYDVVFYFDSEGGGLYDFIKNSGCDMSKIEHVLVASTEEAATKMLTTYKHIEEEIKACQEKNEPVPKVLCILDSFGMLVSSKVLTDATEKDKMTGDMGSAAKLKNNLIKAMTIPVLKTNAALIVINHIYDNPGQMHPTKIKEQPGGKGLQFASHIIVQSTKSLQKDKDNGLVEGESYFRGNNIKYFTTKNRLVKLGYEAEMFVDLNYGISKYDGLIEDAKRYGFIIGGGAGRYKVPTYSDKSVTMKDILSNDDIWNTFIKEFNEKSEKDMQYGSGASSALNNDEDDQDEEDNIEDTLVTENN